MYCRKGDDWNGAAGEAKDERKVLCHQRNAADEDCAAQGWRSSAARAASARVLPRSSFVVYIFAKFQDLKRVYFVLEYGVGGELFNRINELGAGSLSSRSNFMSRKWRLRCAASTMPASRTAISNRIIS